MKKFYLILIALFGIMPNIVFASGSISPSVTSLTVEEGKTVSFTITASNVTGKVDILSSNSSIATVDKTTEWMDDNTVTVTVTGESAGSTIITVNLSDAATYDVEELTNTYTIKVAVTSASSSSSTSDSNYNIETAKSMNNNLESLEVEGYDLEYYDGIYNLTVGTNVSEINILAVLEDSDASLTGDGFQNLSIGENTFKVVVTSESGSTRTYQINAIRKDAVYLEDLSKELIESSENKISVKIYGTEYITNDIINEIKESGKIVNFNYYNDENIVIYTFVVDGNLISGEESFYTLVTFSYQTNEEIEEILNYSYGQYINLNDKNIFTDAIHLKVYVTDSFNNANTLNLYYIDKENISYTLINDSLEINEGYLEFSLESNFVYFITQASIENLNTEEVSIVLVLLIIFVVLIITLIKFYKKII